MLRVENLDVFYGDVQALNSVSLEIEEGAIVAIIGANGAGKTTLIRALAGMLPQARGTVIFGGTDISRWPSHRVCDLGLGQVAEGRQVFPTLTVAENLDIGAMLPRARAQRAKNRERVLAMFPKLAERSRQPAGTLSGGEQQMLAIGRCLMGARNSLCSTNLRSGSRRSSSAVCSKPSASSTARASPVSWSSRMWRCRSSLRAAPMCWKTDG